MSAATRPDVDPTAPDNRKATLLALDGRCLDRLALPLVLPHCQRGGRRLDILLAHPPQTATAFLGGFLAELERHGIDFRLTSSNVDIDLELTTWVNRLPYVSVILLDCHAHWDGEENPALNSLRARGYRVTSLQNHRQDGKPSRTTLLDSGQAESA